MKSMEMRKERDKKIVIGSLEKVEKMERLIMVL